MLTVSPARPEDVETIFQLNRQLIDQYEDMDSIDYPRVLHWVRRNIERTLPHFHRVMWNGELAGFYALIPGNDKWEIDSLFVLPAFQNRGIGTKILKSCQDASPVPLFLYVFRENIRAMDLYKRMGFEITQEVGNTRYILEWTRPDC